MLTIIIYINLFSFQISIIKEKTQVLNEKNGNYEMVIFLKMVIQSSLLINEG